MAGTSTARRRGRRIGIAVFVVLVSAFTIVCSIQILTQVFAPATTEPALGCRDAVRALLQAVQRARNAAAASTGDERVALERFRSALAPEWNWRGALDETCRGDPQALRALAQVDQLRYAEEHAVRYEAVGLASLRRRVQSIDNDLHEGK